MDAKKAMQAKKAKQAMQERASQRLRRREDACNKAAAGTIEGSKRGSKGGSKGGTEGGSENEVKRSGEISNFGEAVSVSGSHSAWEEAREVRYIMLLPW